VGRQKSEINRLDSPAPKQMREINFNRLNFRNILWKACVQSRRIGENPKVAFRAISKRKARQVKAGYPML
jgi:hypothetical protein